jgi:hypothetical protein
MFSNTERSLYKSANSSLSAIKNLFVKAGCATSCPKAATIAETSSIEVKLAKTKLLMKKYKTL